MSGQKLNFYGYIDGYQEDRLRLGNMVLDYRNPDSRRSCIRQARHARPPAFTYMAKGC